MIEQPPCEAESEHSRRDGRICSGKPFGFHETLQHQADRFPQSSVALNFRNDVVLHGALNVCRADENNLKGQSSEKSRRTHKSSRRNEAAGFRIRIGRLRGPRPTIRQKGRPLSRILERDCHAFTHAKHSAGKCRFFRACISCRIWALWNPSGRQTLPISRILPRNKRSFAVLRKRFYG